MDLTIQLLINSAISLIVSLAVAWYVYPKILLISIHKNIVDSPNARKLQKMPVPILGGFVVFSGILAAFLCVSTQIDVGSLFPIFCIMTVLLLIGLADDIISLSAKGRLLTEVIVVIMLIFSDKSVVIDNLHGLWGVHAIPLYLALPLTVVAGVGIINAINLIDGIDGLASGYCAFACSIFVLFFYITQDYINVYLALAAIGGLIPFFMHNVFGKYSKMFIGDAGSLLMGSVMAYFVMSVMDTSLEAYDLQSNFGIIPFLLSIFSVPVFETLRVMTTRIFKGVSPFRPDKTHLHHMFIRLGYSHIGATVTILALNTMVVAVWFIMYCTGCSVDLQFYVIVFLSLLITGFLYQYVEWVNAKCIAEGRKLSGMVKLLTIIGRKLGVERGPFLKFMGRWMDGCVKEADRKILIGE